MIREYVIVTALVAIFHPAAHGAEQELIGDQTLREMVINALESNAARVSRGHWQGEVFLGTGITAGKFQEEGGGPLELVWDGKKTWAKSKFLIIDRYPPESKSENGLEIVSDETRFSILYKTRQGDSGNVFDIDSTYVYEARAHMRPDEVWFRRQRGHPFLWSQILSEKADLPSGKFYKCLAEKDLSGVIHVMVVYHNLGDAIFHVWADPRQGLNIVRWRAEWQENLHSEGTATWKPTEEGAWYPEEMEYRVYEPPPADYISEHLRLKTTYFDSTPTIPKNRFDLLSTMPPGTNVEYVARDGKRLKRIVVGRPDAPSPEELLNRLGEAAKQGTASPERGSHK